MQPVSSRAVMLDDGDQAALQVPGQNSQSGANLRAPDTFVGAKLRLSRAHTKTYRLRSCLLTNPRIILFFNYYSPRSAFWMLPSLAAPCSLSCTFSLEETFPDKPEYRVLLMCCFLHVTCIGVQGTLSKSRTFPTIFSLFSHLDPFHVKLLQVQSWQPPVFLTLASYRSEMMCSRAREAEGSANSLISPRNQPPMKQIY